MIMEEKLLGRGSRPLYKDPLAIVIAVLCVIIFAWVLFSFRFVGIYVVGSSMEPTLSGAEKSYIAGGDYLYADSMAVPDYGDIVVVLKPNAKEYIIKRVIAIGGDAVYMEQGTVYISYGNSGTFTALKEDYVLEENNDPFLPQNTYRSKSDPLIVPKGSMFLLGDNRGNRHAYSLDSRTYGPFTYDEMVGVVPRWSISAKNFFTGLYTFVKFGV